MKKRVAPVETPAPTMTLVALAQDRGAKVAAEVTQEVNQAQVATPKVTVEAVAEVTVEVIVIIAKKEKKARKAR